MYHDHRRTIHSAVIIIFHSCVFLQRPSRWSAPQPSYQTSALNLPSRPSAITSSRCARRAPEGHGGASSAVTSARLWRTTCAMRSTASHAPTLSSSCSWSCPRATCFHTPARQKLPAAFASACHRNVGWLDWTRNHKMGFRAKEDSREGLISMKSNVIGSQVPSMSS